MLAALPTPREIRAAGGLLAAAVLDQAPRSVALVGARGPVVARALATLAEPPLVVLVDEREDVLAGVRRALGERADALTVHRVAPAALAAGIGQAAVRNVELVVLDGTLDVLPDRLARTLVRVTSRWLAPGGRLVTSALPGTADAAFWDHVGAWPLVRRDRAALLAMTERARLVPVDRSPSDTLLVARRAR